MFKYFDLGARNTALMHCTEFSKLLGVSFYVKRDDVCGTKFGMNGGDSRKIEFLMASIADEKPDNLVIISQYRSNFTRMLVQAVSNMVRCHVVYIDDFDAPLSYNLSQIQLCGAHTHGTQDKQYFEHLVQSLKDKGETVMVVKPGGSCSVAAMGGYALFNELANDCVANDISSATVYLSSDSGATQAGMLSAAGIYATLGNPVLPTLTIVGVPLTRDPETQLKLVSGDYLNLATLCSDEERSEIQAENIEIPILLSDSSYSENSELLALAKQFYQYTNLVVDYLVGLPVLAALVLDVQEGRIDGPVIFVNPVSPTVPFYTY